MKKNIENIYSLEILMSPELTVGTTTLKPLPPLQHLLAGSDLSSQVLVNYYLVLFSSKMSQK